MIVFVNLTLQLVIIILIPYFDDDFLKLTIIKNRVLGGL